LVCALFDAFYLASAESIASAAVILAVTMFFYIRKEVSALFARELICTAPTTLVAPAAHCDSGFCRAVEVIRRG
jgi:hypothetical protein